MAERTLTAPAGTRSVTDDDADALIALIASVYAEYPGCVLDLDGVDADLVAPGTIASRRGSPWWVLDTPDGIGASVGAGPVQDRTVELKRLYVAPSQRRRGLATTLVRAVESHALQVGATTVELWSDTRFGAAHRLYDRLGYTRTGRQRELHDPSHTTEWHFLHPLARP